MEKMKTGKKDILPEDVDDNSDDLDGIGDVKSQQNKAVAAKGVKKPKAKKKKKKGQDDYDDDEDANEVDILKDENAALDVVNTKKSKKAPKPSLGMLSLLADSGDMMEDMGIGDDDDDAVENEGTSQISKDSNSGKLVNDPDKTTANESKKKKKDKKKKTKQDDDEMAEIDALLADIEAPVEKKGKKSKKEKQSFIASNMDDDGPVQSMDEENIYDVTNENNGQNENQQTEGKKSKKKKKDSEMTADELAAMIESKATVNVVSIDDLDDDYDDDYKTRKKKKGKKEEQMSKLDGASEEVKDKDDSDTESTVKSAAQKKKEKKEREREKKEREREKKKKVDKTTLVEEARTVDDSDNTQVQKEDSGQSVKDATPVVEASDTKDVDKPSIDADVADDQEKKKKKKKGKKEESEKKTGKPTKKIAAIREHLKMLQEEEEKRKREEEERERLEQEAIRKREEEKRLFEERKQQKKQREKEKIERQKREGTYLTNKQKAEKKRAEEMLTMMRAAGLAVPGRDATQRRKPIGQKRKPKPQSVDDETIPTEGLTPPPAEGLTPPPTEGLTPPPAEIEEGPTNNLKVDDDVKDDDKEKELLNDDDNDDVKDAWDESESEEDAKDESITADETQVKVKTGEHPAQEMKFKGEKPSKVITLDNQKKDVAVDVEAASSESSDESESSSESDSEDDSSSEVEDDKAPLLRAREKIQRRHEDAEKKRTVDELRAPVVCVLGHVDTGKTKILDKLRRTNVQDGEAGGITQQIGATNVPKEAILEKTSMCKEFQDSDFKLPGMLIIDTPGHESFSNLRSRGSSLCDIAVLVVDIMHGLEPQTVESINLLRKGNTPFIVALNKIDRLYQWVSFPHSDVISAVNKQQPHTKMEFDTRVKETIVQFAEQGLNVTLFNENKNPREYISLVPTSAHSGDGMGNLLALLCQVSQSLLSKRLSYSEELQATVMEVKTLPGLGTTIDVILVNGCIRESDTIVIAGTDGPIVSQIRGLLLPQPMKELRVKSQYDHCKKVRAAQGVKLIGKDFEKAIAGLPLYVAQDADEVLFYKVELERALEDVLSSIKLCERGVFVQASTIGSLEALLEFLRTSKIPYAGINIGPVHKKDIMKASVMLERDSQYAVILAFDVKIDRDAQEMADSQGVRIFSADIIYHLFDKFMAYRDELRKSKQDEYRHKAVYPCKARILPQFIFNSRDPIVCGVIIEAGLLKVGTPICVPSKEFIDLGRISSIEVNHKQCEVARKGQEVCIKIESSTNDAPKMFGRHFDATDMLVSKISRQSIDVLKEWFRDELQKSDWQLIVELKKTFEIL